MLKIVLTSLLLWASAASAVTLDQLQHRFASQPVIRADFTQTRTISGMHQPLVSHGQILIAREQGLWWHQQTPFVMTLLLDDKRMVQSLSGQKPQVITADSNPQMFQFNHLLRALFQADQKVLNENFSVAFSDRGNGAWTLDLTPKVAPLNKIFNRISLAGNALLDSINLDDKQGDKTQIQLSNTRIEPPQLSDEEQARFAGPE